MKFWIKIEAWNLKFENQDLGDQRVDKNWRKYELQSILRRYIAIFISVKSSMEQMELMGKSSSKANEYKLAKKLMLIVFTDFLCWVSSKYCNPVQL